MPTLPSELFTQHGVLWQDIKHELTIFIDVQYKKRATTMMFFRIDDNIKNVV